MHCRVVVLRYLAIEIELYARFCSKNSIIGVAERYISQRYGQCVKAVQYSMIDVPNSIQISLFLLWLATATGGITI